MKAKIKIIKDILWPRVKSGKELIVKYDDEQVIVYTGSCSCSGKVLDKSYYEVLEIIKE